MKENRIVLMTLEQHILHLNSKIPTKFYQNLSIYIFSEIQDEIAEKRKEIMFRGPFIMNGGGI